MRALDYGICLWISCRNDFSFYSIIIYAHIMEILTNELTSSIKGNEIRSWISSQPFLFDYVSYRDGFFIIILFNFEPTCCWVDHRDTP